MFVNLRKASTCRDGQHLVFVVDLSPRQLGASLLGPLQTDFGRLSVENDGEFFSAVAAYMTVPFHLTP